MQSWKLFVSVAISATFLLSQSTMAQVVATDAAVNVDGLYSNWSTNGNASLTSPVASSYNNYRKGGSGVVPTAADSGDGVLGTWSNINHAPTVTPCCGNPGMFFGNSPSPKTYSDAILNIGTNIEADNSNQGLDTGGRRNFDMRIGFVESPADYVAAFGGAGSGHYDLWTANWGTDGIQLNVHVGGTDDVTGGNSPTGTHMNEVADGGNQVDPTNRYIGISAAIRGQSGVDNTLVDERDRDRWRSPTNTDPNAIAPLVPTVVDTSQPALSLAVTATGGGNLGGRFDTGIALDQNVPLEWGMELNDPTNADAALARQVRLDVTAGNVVFSQVFDPGDAANPVTPNSISGIAFEDGFFDWQNSTPVFFIGPGGGAGVDPNAALTIGFTAPDVGLLCDLDADNDCDIADLDILYAGTPDADAIGTWLDQASDPANPAKGAANHVYKVGDVDLNGTVDSGDLGILLNNFSSTTVNSFGGGDLDDSSSVTSADLGLLLNNFGFESPAAAAAAVPEPATQSLLLLAVAGMLLAARRK